MPLPLGASQVGGKVVILQRGHGRNAGKCILCVSLFSVSWNKTIITRSAWNEWPQVMYDRMLKQLGAGHATAPTADDEEDSYE